MQERIKTLTVNPAESKRSSAKRKRGAKAVKGSPRVKRRAPKRNPAKVTAMGSPYAIFALNRSSGRGYYWARGGGWTEQQNEAARYTEASALRELKNLKAKNYASDGVIALMNLDDFGAPRKKNPAAKPQAAYFVCALFNRVKPGDETSENVYSEKLKYWTGAAWSRDKKEAMRMTHAAAVAVGQKAADVNKGVPIGVCRNDESAQQIIADLNG